MKFKAKLDIETETKSTLSEEMKSDEDLKFPNVTVDLNANEKPEDMAEIEITFEATDPPKPLIKISDRLSESITYTPSDDSNNEK